MNFGWSWDNPAEYARKKSTLTISAMHLAAVISQACDELYQFRPGDDTTVAVMEILARKQVNLMTGPASNPADDERMVADLTADEEAVRVVCDGTSSLVVSRVLEKVLATETETSDPAIPPIAYINGIDLVTEGVITLNRTLTLLEQYAKCEEVDEAFFKKLEEKNGAAMLTKLLIEGCTDLHIFVGRAINSAYQNTEISFNLGIRQSLVEQIEKLMEGMGRKVVVTYY